MFQSGDVLSAAAACLRACVPRAQIDAADIAPTLTWGTSPQDVGGIGGRVPRPADITDPQRRAAVERYLTYMGFEVRGWG